MVLRAIHVRCAYTCNRHSLSQANPSRKVIGMAPDKKNKIDDERNPMVVSPEWQAAIDEAIEQAKATGKTKGHHDNIKSYGKHNALEFQSIGVWVPHNVTRDAYIAWHGILESKKFKGDYRTKRNDVLKLLFKAVGAEEALGIACQWKNKFLAPEIKFWTTQEVEAMMRVIRELASKPETLVYAAAGILANRSSPRVSDLVALKWDNFRFGEGILTFRARKNGKRCTAPIDSEFLSIIRAWYEQVKTFEGGSTWVFPKSIVATHGGRKNDSPIISEKTIRKWLNEKIRDSASLPDGSPVQKLSPHHWRHTNAIRILLKTGNYYYVKGLLGDEIRTLERHYTTFVYTRASRKKISDCLAGRPVKKGGQRGDLWPQKQIVNLAQGEFRLNSKKNNLCAQTYEVENFIGNPDTEGLSDDKPSFYDWQLRHHSANGLGGGFTAGFSGPGEI